MMVLYSLYYESRIPTLGPTEGGLRARLILTLHVFRGGRHRGRAREVLLERASRRQVRGCLLQCGDEPGGCGSVLCRSFVHDAGVVESWPLGGDERGDGCFVHAAESCANAGGANRIKVCDASVGRVGRSLERVNLRHQIL